jgi:hypothetical protein
MRLKKLITDTANIDTVQIVDNSYILLGTEEWVESAYIAELAFNYNRIDYIRFRKYLKYLAENFWVDLDAENRHICIDNYVKPEAVSWESTGYTDPELFNYWVRVVDLEKDCRINRANNCIQQITWYFTMEQSMIAYNDIKQILEDWKQCEWQELVAFVNSLNITVATFNFDYTSNGFASKSYYTLDRLNLVNEILFND